jgi:hypothetical protein
MSTIPQLAALKQRKQQLDLQQARYGISADPSITIEASNLETVIHQMDLIEIARRNLAHYLQQRQHFGANVPDHIQASIDTTRADIEQRRAACWRYGHSVASHPVDSEPPLDAPEPAPVPLPVDPLVLIRRGLRDIEALLRAGLADMALDHVIALQHRIGD